jgi:hypothetical protein
MVQFSPILISSQPFYSLWSHLQCCIISTFVPLELLQICFQLSFSQGLTYINFMRFHSIHTRGGNISRRLCKRCFINPTLHCDLISFNRWYFHAVFITIWELSNILAIHTSWSADRKVSFLSAWWETWRPLARRIEESSQLIYWAKPL